MLSAAFANTMDAIGYFEREPVLAVAVSGGPDSMALLLLSHEWAKKKNGRAVALTVDHGLRPESKKEAKQVGAWCKELGIEHHILNWKPSTKSGIQAQAREARYKLLSGWCREHHILHLLTAHHRGDQAETFFFRLARGSSLRGLACIRSVTEMGGVRLIRPLLGISKKGLMQHLATRNQPWIDDPSNYKPDYTRNVIRAALQSRSDADDIECRAASLAEAFGRIRTALDKKTDEALQAVVTLHKEYSLIDAKTFPALPPEIALLLTERLIRHTIGGYPPRSEKLKRLCTWLTSPDTRSATLSHVMFEYQPKQGVFKVYRQVQPLETAA